MSANEHTHQIMGNLVFLDRNSNWKIFRHCGWQQGKDLRAGGDVLESLKCEISRQIIEYILSIHIGLRALSFLFQLLENIH